jgi:hypothetical protein
VQNVKTKKWNLYPCTSDSSGVATCKDVVVGASFDALGPWHIAGIVVDNDGSEKIVKDKAFHDGSLTSWLGNSMVAFGSADGSR